MGFVRWIVIPLVGTAAWIVAAVLIFDTSVGPGPVYIAAGVANGLWFGRLLGMRYGRSQ
jgi:hypothetical protein